MRLLRLLVALVTGGCAGSGAQAASPSDASAASDAQTPIADASAASDAPASSTSDGAPQGLGFLTEVKADNNACLVQALPTDPATGLSSCEILVGVPGACDSTLGLSPATAALVARIGAYFGDAGAPPGSVCEETQLSPAAPPAAGCVTPQAVGWCYMRGACNADAGTHPCAQALCETAAFFTDFEPVDAGIAVSNWGVWLYCP